MGRFSLSLGKLQQFHLPDIFIHSELEAVHSAEVMNELFIHY